MIDVIDTVCALMAQIVPYAACACVTGRKSQIKLLRLIRGNSLGSPERSWECFQLSSVPRSISGRFNRLRVKLMFSV